MKKYIKTQCGIDKYNELREKSYNGILHKLRFYLFCLIATIRDMRKK